MFCCKFRSLKGGRILFVLLWNLLLFSYHQSALGNLVNLLARHVNEDSETEPWVVVVISAALSDLLPKLFYPLAGWLADAKLGRYVVMRYSLWMMWLGSILLILTSIISYSLLIPSSVDNNNIPKYTIAVHVVVYIINALGIAGYHVNVIPFGIDQMEGPSGDQIASFIHWYYWTRNFNFGVLVQFGIQLVWTCNDLLEHRQRFGLIILIIQMVFLTGALCLDFVFSSRLFKDVKIHDPVRKVTKISAFIFKHKHPVGQRLAHTYTYDSPPARSDFAKRTYGGPFEDDAVEEVVSFWRMVLFLLPAGFAVLLIQTGYFNYSSFFEHMKAYRTLSKCKEYLITNVVSIGTISLCIPLYEFAIYPVIRNHISRTTVRIGLGFLVSLLGMSALIAIDAVGHHRQAATSDSCMFFSASHHEANKIPIENIYLIPIIVVMAFGEMLAFISTLEFVVAQSPYGMRGLMLGINYMLYGIFVGLGGIVLMAFSLGWKHVEIGKQPSCGTSFIMTVVTISFLGAVIYLISAKNYKQRQRGQQVDINHQTVLESYYEN